MAVARKGEASLAQIAKDFGISEGSLAHWRKKADIEDGHRPGLTDADRSDLRGDADDFQLAVGGLIGALTLAAGLLLLFTGRYPAPLFDLLVGLNRWVYRVTAYVALMTDTYPPFRLDQGPADPSGVAPTPSTPDAPATTGLGRPAGVVEDVVGGRADQLHAADAAHAGDVSAEGLGDLHGEPADALPMRR